MKDHPHLRTFCCLLVLAVTFLALVPLQAVDYALAGEVQSGAQEPEAEGRKAALDLSEYLPAWAGYEIAGVAVWQFAASFLLILLGLAAKKVSDRAFEARIIPLLQRTRYTFDNLLASAASAPLGLLFLLAGIAGALAVLPLPREPNVRAFADGVLKILVAGDVVWFLFRVIDVAIEYVNKLARRTESKLDEQLIPLLRKALKMTIGVIAAVWMVQLLGYSVSSLIAGLGIGGLAVALALQDTLANFFGSIVIFLDRPFIVGDWIKVEGVVEGIVEQIGFRSTRVRTWPATLLSIPNKTLAAANIDNWSRMPKRRVVQTVGVTYETTADQMEEAVQRIRTIVENDEGVDKEFIVVRFTDFGESSLNILLYYFTVALDFTSHNQTRERINLAIMRMLDEMGLAIAFPTRTVYFEGNIARNTAAASTGDAPRR